MHRFAFRGVALVVEFTLSLLLSGCGAKSEAEQDIAAGKLRLKKIKGGDADGAEFLAFVELLKEKCGAEVVFVEKPATAEEKAGIDSYNHRMQEEIEKRHGTGIIAMVDKETKQKVAAERGAAKE